MSLNIDYYIMGDIQCLDCRCDGTVKVPASTDSRNTLIANDSDRMTLPDGWVKVEPKWDDWQDGREGYQCPTCQEKAKGKA